MSGPGARLFRLGFQAMTSVGGSSRLSVLIFHRVLSQPDDLLPNEPTAAMFRSRLRWLRDRFDILRLGEAIQLLREDRLPARALSITFDDGYADNLHIAAPILRECGICATFFIATGFLDGGRMFNDTVIEAIRRAPAGVLDLQAIGLDRYSLGDSGSRRAAIHSVLKAIKYLPANVRNQRADDVARACGGALPEDLMMRSEEVVALHRAGMEVGAHTVTHPILAETPFDICRKEIEDGRRRLQELVGDEIGLFAYPNGRPDRDYTAAHVQLLRELGFDAAVTTAWGAASPDDDRFQIPRFTPWDAGNLRFGVRLARNVTRPGFATVDAA